MENEENRGLIVKKDYEDQWESFWLKTFFQFSFGALSLFSLSHSWTLIVFLEHFSIGSRKAKRKQRSSKEEQD